MLSTTHYLQNWDAPIQTRVVDTQYPGTDGQLGILLEVTNASPKGVKLRPEKGLNFPDAVLPLSPLTEKDLSDLDFVATHADIMIVSQKQVNGKVGKSGLTSQFSYVYSFSV